MSDFDLSLSGAIVLPDRIIEAGYVAVRDGKIAAVVEPDVLDHLARNVLRILVDVRGGVDSPGGYRRGIKCG